MGAAAVPALDALGVLDDVQGDANEPHLIAQHVDELREPVR